MTTAATTYTQRQANARALISRLTAALDAHAERASERPDDWGFVGDVGSVEATLQELVVGFGG